MAHIPHTHDPDKPHETRETPDMQDSLDLALATAEAAARETGAFLLSRRGQARVEHPKAARDDLLDVDLEAEAIILRRLRIAFPTYGIDSEEAGSDAEPRGRTWIIDPLDGSANFQHNNPTFGVAIGLVEGAITVLAAIYLPAFDEMYTAIRGRGARRNFQPIYVSATGTLAEAIIHVGDFATSGNDADNQPRVNAVARLANAAYRVRMVGTAATDFAYVASGRADGLVMYRSHPWDINAGRLLVEEAGGRVSAVVDEKDVVFNVYTNGLIHDELCTLLNHA
jgi:myo-inositol-1(or 4)-monophosphatase